MLLSQQQPLDEFLHLIFGINILIGIILIAFLRLCINLIREIFHPLLVLSVGTLIVYVSINGVPGTFSMIVHPIAVGYILMVSAVHVGKAITIILTVAAIHSQSYRQQS